MIGPLHEHREKNRWTTAQAMVLTGAGLAALLALLCWQVGALTSFAGIQVKLLLGLLLMLNLTPVLVELLCHRFDPFDAKHLFLAYFFLIFTFSSFCEIKYGIVRPGFAVNDLDDSIRIRALAAILLGLAAFVIGCYLPIGARLAKTLPNLPEFPAIRVKLVAILGIASGVVAFYFLMKSAGGITGFLQNLGSWRTLGVLAGVGYLTFPISTILPASVLLLLLVVMPAPAARLPWSVPMVLILAVLSIIPVLILGFRVTLVPILFQFLIVWHYQRKRLRFGWLFAIGAILIAGLSIYANMRNRDSSLDGDVLSEAVLFRTPGLATVERVVQRIDQGEPYRGLSTGVIEAMTILVPRAIWPGKPQTAGLEFDDIFFYDFYIGRGDPIDGLKSGVSPSSVGEALWIRGICMVLFGFLGLGITAKTMTVWRAKSPGSRLHLFIFALFCSNFPIFVEAPQNALNLLMMFAAMSGLMATAISVHLPAGRRSMNS